MKTIAFVDDDQRVLDGLRRLLRGFRKDWDLSFFSSGEEMLKAFADTKFDIVVSDMRMPSMNGAELLTTVKEQSPGTLRIVLSGYANEELILESIHAIHQFISKPASQDDIVKTIQRGIRLQEALDSSYLKSLLGSVDSLPAMPEIYDELMREIASENASLEQVGKIVERDMALTSSLLKLVNSAFFSLVRHIETPSQAAAILGSDMIKNLALSNSIFSSFEGTSGQRRLLEQLNRMGQQVGILAGQFAKVCEVSTRSRDHAQLAGMMINLGGLLEVILGDQLKQHGDIEAPETELLGSYLLGIWAMPFPIVEAVRWYKQPALSNIDVISPVAIVHAAWAMLTICKEHKEVDLDSETIDVGYLDAVVGRDKVNKWKSITEDFLNNVNSDNE